MSFVTVDFESYYGDGWGFKTQTNEEYLNDPRWETIGVGIKIDDGPSHWYTGPMIATALGQIDWNESAVLCHNAKFDGSILEWKYGIRPAYYYDTLCMARAIHGVNVRGSLAALASKYGIGEKGNEAVNASGKRAADFSPAELARYGEYCKNDVELTYRLFQILSEKFPPDELDLIDITLRMYTRPVMHIDVDLLKARLKHVEGQKLLMLSGLKKRLGVETEAEVSKILGSNPKFAAVLREYNIVPPMKESPATGKETYAFAKTDEGFIELTQHEDPWIQQLCAVRLGTKSTLEESRINNFIGIAERNHGQLPIPLKYYAAHTGRWGGDDGINMQNLPTRNKEKKTLKHSLRAPPGHTIVNSDSSQIEARVLPWWAGQDNLVESFRQGRDVYSEFATEVYHKPVSKETPVERFVGKESILSLGFGVGAKKLRRSLKIKGDVILTEEDCMGVVSLYRERNEAIVALWSECDRALEAMMAGVKEPFWLGKNEIVLIDAEGIRLPNGLHIRYANLRRGEINGKYSIIYDSREGPKSIWGGAMVENIVQALARIVVGQQMIWISRRYSIALTVHDAAVLVVPTEELEEAADYVTLCMSTSPVWAESLPVACEVKCGQTYGDC